MPSVNRDELQSAGIHIPALPLFISGGLPEGFDWPPFLIRHGIDVVSSGENPDTDASLAALSAASPHRPVKACGTAARLEGRPWLVDDTDVPEGAIGINPDQVVTGIDGIGQNDPNIIASTVLPLVQAEPARWWVTARGLESVTPEEAQQAIIVFAEGIHYIRLYIAKHQFDLE